MADTSLAENAPLELRVLGHFELAYRDSGELIPVSSARTRALLAYLAAAPRLTETRRRLAGLLWTNRGEDQARQALRQSLSNFRRGALPGVAGLVTFDDTGVSLDPSLVAIDRTDLMGYHRHADITELSRIADLYRNDFGLGLEIGEDEFDNWLHGERRRCRDAAVTLFDRLVRALAAAGSHREALTRANRLAEIDPTREETHRLVIAQEAIVSGRASAMLRYEAFRLLLRDEIGIRPEPATLRLLDELRRQSTLPEPTESASVRAPTPARLPDDKLSPDKAPDESGLVADLPSLDNIPQQVPRASRFAANADGLIDVVPDPPEHGPSADKVQRELYEEMRHKALALSAVGNNQLSHLSRPLSRFIDAAPERLQDVSIARLWSRGNTLRRRLKSHHAVATSSDITDPARLPPLVAESLWDLVESFNLFVAGDLSAREFDQVRIGPQERADAQAAVESAQPISEALKVSEGVATPEAIDALSEQLDAARNSSAGIDGDQAIELSRKTSGNIISEMLRVSYAWIRGAITSEGKFAWKEYRAGAYRAAGPGSATVAYLYRHELIAFIADNASSFITFIERTFHNPALIRIVDIIAKSFGSI